MGCRIHNGSDDECISFIKKKQNFRIRKTNWYTYVYGNGKFKRWIMYVAATLRIQFIFTW